MPHRSKELRKLQSNLEFPLWISQVHALSQFSYPFLSFFPQILDQLLTYTLQLERCSFSTGLSIYWCNFPTSGYLNQKPSEQHGQGNHITSGHLNQISCPCHTQVTFFAFRTMWVQFRQPRQSLLLFLKEYGNSHSLAPFNSCFLSHSLPMSSSQNVQLGVDFFVRVLLQSGGAVYCWRCCWYMMWLVVLLYSWRLSSS